MNLAPASSIERRRWWILAVAIAMLPLMINNDSFWIDEGVTGLYASQRTLAAWWKYMNEDPGSDALQPLGMFFSWLTGRLIGTAEWQLRSVNVLWGALTLLFVWLAGQSLGMKWLTLLFVIQPFFVFQTNEARPYAVQNTCGAALLWVFSLFLRERARGCRWCVLFTVIAVLSCYATALAPIFLISLAFVAGFVAWRNRWKIEKKNYLIPLLGLATLIPAALHYAHTMRRGAGSAKLWNVDVRYLGYVAYDLGGAAGLGPPVDQLRLLGRNLTQLVGHGELFLHFLCGALLLLCIAIAFLILVLGRKSGSARTLAFVLITPFLLEVAIFFALGLATHKNLWPRHLNIAFPFYVAALGIALRSAFNLGSFVGRALTVLVILLLVWSSLRLRYSTVYAKEDYRWATAEALQLSRAGRRVWWAANKGPGRYYGLTLVTSKPRRGEAFSTHDAQERGILSEPDVTALPDDIFLSRPDVHDIDGVVSRLIRKYDYHLKTTHPSFEWWSR
jgi:hypothetical protein